MIEKECQLCGKKFKTFKELQKYCSRECLKEWTNLHRINDKRILKAKKRAKAKSKEIGDLNAEARAHGMSYGQYVAWKSMQKGGV